MTTHEHMLPALDAYVTAVVDRRLAEFADELGAAMLVRRTGQQTDSAPESVELPAERQAQAGRSAGPADLSLLRLQLVAELRDLIDKALAEVTAVLVGHVESPSGCGDPRVAAVDGSGLPGNPSTAGESA